MSTLIIAEAGVNHGGCEQRAIELVDVAKQVGANIVKFQSFKASNLVTPGARQARYQSNNMGQEQSQLEMLKALELSFDVQKRLASYCDSIDIEFLSTAFDSASLQFLVRDIGLKRLKIPSGEITNAPFLLEHARTGCELIMSTGMATLAEIEQALSVLAFGFLHPVENSHPCVDSLYAAYSSEQGQRLLQQKVTLLHCTSEYPAPVEQVNLRAMISMQSAFGLACGYSDHTLGSHIPVAAVALGATVIEKHFTLDKGLEGPDHKASMEPRELDRMVSEIRATESALGDGIKKPTPSEVQNKVAIRKSIVATRDIGIGDNFCEGNLGIMRPGNGHSPFGYWDLLGKASRRAYHKGDVILD